MIGRRVHFFIFDDLDRFLDRFAISPANARRRAGERNGDGDKLDGNDASPKFIVALSLDGYCLSVFHNVLTTSANYRKLVAKNLLQNIPSRGDVNVRVSLSQPKAEVLDYGWSGRLNKLVVEKQELEYSMSWLSTLGGAFSALGDNFEYCAKVAGKISVQQFQIALKLGEPPLAARCKLYMALSLIQQRNLRIAKKIIQEQYEVAKKFKDFRLMNMCKGTWAKLQHTHKIEKLNKAC